MYIAIVCYDNAHGMPTAQVVEDDNGMAIFTHLADIESLKTGHWLENAMWYAFDIETGEAEEVMSRPHK